ncbi:MAG: hypothetical protein ACJAV1_001155 [Paraglaciecola sp.]|jgi:hypothetical protein
MYAQVEKPKENKSGAVANSVAQKKRNVKQGFGFVDNRPERITQRKTASQDNYSSSLPIQKKENNTDLPDNLKSGIENLSGYSMDDVKVHYNSDKPVQLQAHAYAQGTDIHLAPRQEKHLPHEAWHVVQQKQGRVKHTKQMKGGVNINDDVGLEKEADVMGAKALQSHLFNKIAHKDLYAQNSKNNAIQRATIQLVGDQINSVLGADAYDYITSVMNGNSPYTDDGFLTQRANELILAGIHVDNIKKLMRGLGRVVKRQGTYQRCLGWAVDMINANVPVGIVTPLIINHMRNVAQAQSAHYIALVQEFYGLGYGYLDKFIKGYQTDAGGRTLPNWVLIARVIDNDVPNLISIARLATWNDAATAQLIAVIRPLHADGLNWANTLQLLNRLIAEGQNSNEIDAFLLGLRNHMQVGAANSPNDRSITDVPDLTVAGVAAGPAGAPGIPAAIVGAAYNPLHAYFPPIAPVPGVIVPLAPQHQPGNTALTGQDIHAHVEATFASGRNSLTASSNYPTGQQIATRDVNQLWLDCRVTHGGALLLPNTTGGQPNETAAQRLVRQKMALQELIARHAGRGAIVQSIFSHDEGQSARPFHSILDEDGYNVDGHNSSRHVIGGGNMNNLESLALRVCTKIPHCGVKATAFNSVAEADGAITPVLNAGFLAAVNWQVSRAAILAAAHIPAINVATAAGICLRKTDAVRGNPYLPANMVGRPLIDAHAPYALGVYPAQGMPNPLTHEIGPINRITIVFRDSDFHDGGGWCVYTAYPSIV